MVAGGQPDIAEDMVQPLACGSEQRNLRRPALQRQQQRLLAVGILLLVVRATVDALVFIIPRGANVHVRHLSLGDLGGSPHAESIRVHVADHHVRLYPTLARPATRAVGADDELTAAQMPHQ